MEKTGDAPKKNWNEHDEKPPRENAVGLLDVEKIQGDKRENDAEELDAIDLFFQMLISLFRFSTIRCKVKTETW